MIIIKLNVSLAITNLKFNVKSKLNDSPFKFNNLKNDNDRANLLKYNKNTGNLLFFFWLRSFNIKI